MRLRPKVKELLPKIADFCFCSHPAAAPWVSGHVTRHGAPASKRSEPLAGVRSCYGGFCSSFAFSRSMLSSVTRMRGLARTDRPRRCRADVAWGRRPIDRSTDADNLFVGAWRALLRGTILCGRNSPAARRRTGRIAHTLQTRCR
jgi:hypothetical protein